MIITSSILIILSVYTWRTTTQAFNSPSVTSNNHGISCAPWNYMVSSSGQCKCIYSLRQIKCTDEGTLLRNGYCTTYKECEGLFLSRCPYISSNYYNVSKQDPRFIVLPNNISELEDYMCRPMNRKGFLCSQCIDGFAPSFTSPEYMSCTNCTESSYGVPLFIIIELIPATFFYLMFLVLQINVTSSPMTCYIFYSQVIMYTATPSGRGSLLEYSGKLFDKRLFSASYAVYGM